MDTRCAIRALGATPRAVAQFWQAHRDHQLIGLRTSGTATGTVHMIVRTTESWVDSFDAVARRCRLGRADRIWIPGPMSATMNLFAACLAEHIGASWTTDDSASATVAQLTPAKLVRLLDSGLSHCGTIRAAIVAGDALRPELCAAALEAGLQVTHYYGAAELSMVAMGTSAADLTLFDCVDLQIRDDLIWVRSPWMCRGFVEDDQFHELPRDPEGFATVGDRGRLDAGHLLVWGREDAVTTAGETVALAPLTARMRGVVAGDVYLVGCPDPRVGQVLTAVVTNRQDLDTLRRWARRELSGASRPRRWVCVPHPPLTPAGKVDLRALADGLDRAHARTRA